jgi:hypothetical protein
MARTAASKGKITAKKAAPRRASVRSEDVKPPRMAASVQASRKGAAAAGATRKAPPPEPSRQAASARTARKGPAPKAAGRTMTSKAAEKTMAPKAPGKTMAKAPGKSASARPTAKGAAGKTSARKAAALKAAAPNAAATRGAPRNPAAKPSTARNAAASQARRGTAPTPRDAAPARRKAAVAPAPAAPVNVTRLPMAGAPQFFTASHLDEADFKSDGLRPYARYRDLGIAAATGGLCQAHVIRLIPPCTDEVRQRHRHNTELQMIYVLKGWIKNEFAGHGVQMMSAGTCWLQPPGIEHTVLDYSADCEMLEIIIPADFETVETA